MTARAAQQQLVLAKSLLFQTRGTSGAARLMGEEALGLVSGAWIFLAREGRRHGAKIRRVGKLPGADAKIFGQILFIRGTRIHRFVRLASN